MEVIINGRDLATIASGHASGRSKRRRNAGARCKISAGNYGGRLGKSFIYLHPEKQPA